MSAPPPPPKRKNHKPLATFGTGSGIPVAVGSGHNVARAINESQNIGQIQHQNHVVKVSNKSDYVVPAPAHKKKNRICSMSDHPDAVIGYGVEIHGDFQFDKLLRIDGKFQGNLFSNNRGDIIVGKSGCVIADVIIARKMIVEGGQIIGKIVADELLLQSQTSIKGDITTKLLQIEGPYVAIIGRANVHALAPELVDEHDNIVTEIPKKVKKPKKEIYAPKSPKKSSKQQQLPDDVSEITEAEDGTSLISADESKVAKAVSSQTNASAKPPRNSKPMQTPEEAAALEAAMIERNTAKERHRQQKAAKKGEEILTAEPILVSPSPTKDDHSKEGAETKDLPPVKSPAKLLPPSEAQRQAQLKIDRGPSTGKPKKTDSNPDSPDIEREKAATQLQRMARGRMARRRTQINDTTKHEESVSSKQKNQPISPKPSTEATGQEKDAENAVETEEEVRRQHEAAKSVQKIARGNIARNNISTQKAPQQLNNAGRENISSEEFPTEVTATAGDGESGEQADGTGYAESLLMQES